MPKPGTIKDTIQSICSILALVVSIYSVAKSNMANGETIRLSSVMNDYNKRLVEISDLQLDEIKKENMPKPSIISLVFKRDEYIRYQMGPTTANVDLGDRIKTYDFATLIEENPITYTNLIDECLSNKNKIYFTYWFNEPCIFLNQIASDKNDFIVDYHNVELTILNTGANILNFKINSILIDDREPIKGNNYWIPCNIGQGEQKMFLFNEATTDLHKSVCRMDETMFDAVQISELNLLDTNIRGMPLEYNKLTINCIFKNIYDDKYEYNLILERQGSYFVSDSKLLGILED